MNVGLLTGRFQPFHNGHLSIIEQIDDECDRIIVVIGSAQLSHQPNNPFTAGERYEMINETLREMDIQHEYEIIPVQDINRYDLYVKHIESMVPKFNVVYTNSSLMMRLFQEAGYEVVCPEIHPVQENTTIRLSATNIRDMMWNPTSPGDWKEFVPEGTQKVIECQELLRRLRIINMGD